MLVENKVHPGKEQMEGFLEAGHEGPIYAVHRDAGLQGQLNIETSDAIAPGLA